MFTSWKTTSLGITMIVGALIGAWQAYSATPFDQPMFMASLTGLLGGIGLLFAKDGDVTGGTRSAGGNGSPAP